MLFICMFIPSFLAHAIFGKVSTQVFFLLLFLGFSLSIYLSEDYHKVWRETEKSSV